MTPVELMTASQEEVVRRAAARALLSSPLLTTRTHPERLAEVRRHARYLTGMFATALGYRLVVEPTFARLVKEPPGLAGPWRGAMRRSGTAFTPRTYTYLALVSAALLTSDIGDQTLVSRLVEQVRAEAQAAGVEVDDQYADRRHLVAALEWLIDHGIIEETEGTVLGWGERLDEALLTVNRNLLPHLLTRPLNAMPGPASLLDGGDSPASTDQPRRTLRRKLVEHPVVWRDDLSDAERDVLSRERTEMTRTLMEAFGLMLEVRAEGALVYDPDDDVSDVTFPGQGSVMQAALLLCDVLIDTHRPQPGRIASLGGGTVRGLGVPLEEVSEALTELIQRYGRGWAGVYRDEPARLRREVIAALEAMSLALYDEHTLVLLPAAARFRPDPQAPATVSRARARLGHVEDPTATLFEES